ncbi:Coilin [Rhynchospora pubera]|uniref:Coilin n=1 Tax=Rhynchospora pubera TaxID=906938 RepID=A0AAV8H2P7_9POAL|nr:Coilin [Rhynchospora pubera]
MRMTTMEEEEAKAPVWVRLSFADRHLLSKAQRSEGLRRSWVLLRPELKTVADFSRDISTRFGLTSGSDHGLFLSMDGFLIPPSESTSIFRDNDKIRVKGGIVKEKEQEAVTPTASAPQIVENEIIYNGGDAIEKENRKKKKRKKPLPEEPSLKGQQEEVERLICPKKKKLKSVANERPVILNEKKNYMPAVATPSQFHPVDQQPNALVLASGRHQQGASISKSTSTRFHGVANGKNANGTCTGYDNQQSSRRYLVPGQTRFMSPGAGPSNWQEKGSKKPFQGDKNMIKNTSWRPRSEVNNPTVHNRNWQQWTDCSCPTNSQLRMDNNFTTEETAEKTIRYGEEINKDKLDFESLYPPACLPREGDIIAYRLDIIDSLGCPDLSSFRVGEVIVFDPVLMIIFVRPVHEYPTPECEISEFEKSMYKEDGGLEIDFECLVDLRLVKECLVRTAPKMHNSGKWKSNSKASNGQNGTESSLPLLGGNDNNVNSAWEVGEASNAKEATESGWGAWPPSTTRAGVGSSRPSMGQYGATFWSHDDFSRGKNCRDGENGNSNSAWMANDEAANANEGTQAQNNSWDTWPQRADQASASWSHMGQHGSGVGGSWVGFSSGKRRGNGENNNSNSAWEANGVTANANEGTRAQNNSWDTWAQTADQASASWSRMGQHGSGFGSWGGFSSGERRGNGENNNSNSAWEANGVTANANEGSRAQNNGWDAWAPNANRASASCSRVGQHGNGFGSWGCFSRGGRRGRRGRRG